MPPRFLIILTFFVSTSTMKILAVPLLLILLWRISSIHQGTCYWRRKTHTSHRTQHHRLGIPHIDQGLFRRWLLPDLMANWSFWVKNLYYDSRTSHLGQRTQVCYNRPKSEDTLPSTQPPGWSVSSRSLCFQTQSTFSFRQSALRCDRAELGGWGKRRDLASSQAS